jgi:3-dehydroquinate dehydratase-2
MQILLINGPNLNMLGKREPEVYGHTTLLDIEKRLNQIASAKGVNLSSFQSNAEHVLIDKIHSSSPHTDGIIINPAAFTHTSVALRDALLSVHTPFIEVHLSNIHQRESFRHHSYLADIAIGTIVGLGASGYEYALDAIIKHLQQQ